MSSIFKRIRDDLITHRFAVTVIAILFGASGAGWILTELIPPDVVFKRDMYAARWGDTSVRLIETLGLHDPFHSFWYRGILALFFVVLVLCLVSRWKSFVLRSFRLAIPRSAAEVAGGEFNLSIRWKDIGKGRMGSRDPLDLLEKRYGKNRYISVDCIRRCFIRATKVLRHRGYSVSGHERDGSIYFAAAAGRVRHFGNLLFHIGIVVITVGGMAGSFWGGAEILYAKAGGVLPLTGSRYSMLVKKFEIVMTPQLEIKDYITNVSFFDDRGDTLRRADIEVNHPVKFKGFSVHQSSYYAGEEEFTWAKVKVVAADGLMPEIVMLRPGGDVSARRTAVTFRAKRFLPDFRMGHEGAFSASPSMNNPALEIEVTAGERTASGWLFLLYPRFDSRFDLPVKLGLVDVEPVFYTGLQVSTNPGANVFLAGITIASIGVCLMYLFHFRYIKGVITTERIRIAGAGYRWKVSFENEFKEIGNELGGELGEEITDV